MKNKLWLLALATIAIGSISLTTMGCLAKEYKVDYCGQKAAFEGAKDSYAAGTDVKLKYGMIASDTDYYFFVDGKRAKVDYQNGFFIISFQMPEHDIKVYYHKVNTMTARRQIMDTKTKAPANGFKSITMAEAQELFKTKGDYVIVDVRRAEEFADGHIPDAINIANESISTEKPAQLPKLDQTIYVYCRSGNRSKQAARKLSAMGYTRIIEFGGIMDWRGEIVK